MNISEFKKNNFIDTANLWKDDNYIISGYANNMAMAVIFGGPHDLHIIDNQIVKNLNNPIDTRVIIGVTTIPEDNILIIVHYKYLENNACVIIEFYNIESNELAKIKEHIINGQGVSCGEISGRVQRINSHLSVVWGDMFNDDYCYYVSFNSETYSEPKKIQLETESPIEKFFFLSEKIYIESMVLGAANKHLRINLYNNELEEDEKLLCDTIFTLPEGITHIHDTVKEVDSKIIDLQFNENMVCLLRLNLEYNIDILHTDEYILDILVNMTKNEVIDYRKLEKYSVNSIIKHDKIFGF
jgi:hypothetical protein